MNPFLKLMSPYCACATSSSRNPVFNRKWTRSRSSCSDQWLLSCRPRFVASSNALTGHSHLVSMRLECLPGLKQCLQAGKNTWPSIGAGSVSGVILGPLVMRHCYFGGFGLGHQFDRGAGRLIILAHCEGVLKDFWRLKPQDLPSDVGRGFAIGSRAHPCEQATRLKVRLKLSAREEDAVRLPRHKAFPDLLRGGGHVEDIFQWCLMGHDCSLTLLRHLISTGIISTGKGPTRQECHWFRLIARMWNS